MMNNGSVTKGNSCVSTATRDMWDNLFDGRFRADVTIRTDNAGIIYAHAAVLGMVLLSSIFKQEKGFGHKRSISVSGVQHDAVRVFIRFLYSSYYEEEEMKELVLPLLVLSHAYIVPQLKRICEQQLEDGLLTLENVVDVFQLSLLCDAPRLALISYSMEALVHICRGGCRTIGPYDKDFKEDQKPCTYAACKGIELLVRHLSCCKLRVPGGCIHCKRMWQLLELHACLCANSSLCRVPLCGNFKEKMKKQGKKDEMKWNMLVKKILSTRRIGGAPFFVPTDSISW
ncbi:BTB/POZ and TAZ domain-containing protein 4 [Hibiscus syriacus]|uniref:BTB/POZ and TAZ domain-containing protein 4 n=1 Tax=Hibiscus syriacus TaxID=106335 RepID=A0A6A3BFB4_HIBSY|nr:BTB/POZ and TAZ domain-containing protein 4 [Hibiscus syriacus]